MPCGSIVTQDKMRKRYARFTQYNNMATERPVEESLMRNSLEVETPPKLPEDSTQSDELQQEVYSNLKSIIIFHCRQRNELFSTIGASLLSRQRFPSSRLFTCISIKSSFYFFFKNWIADHQNDVKNAKPLMRQQRRNAVLVVKHLWRRKKINLPRWGRPTLPNNLICWNIGYVENLDRSYCIIELFDVIDLWVMDVIAKRNSHLLLWQATKLASAIRTMLT